MELAFRESLKKMRGTKSKEKFSQELEMSRSNYSLIESGKSDPTLKTLYSILHRSLDLTEFMEEVLIDDN
ncbi:helix-turn-helix transcriptional regulator, partial [Lactococcus lactis]